LSIHNSSSCLFNRLSAFAEPVGTPYYAILSGFEPGDIPGVGTFYDFYQRLWTASGNNLKPKKHKRYKKTKKGKKKGEKAPTTTPGKVKRLVEWVIIRVVNQPVIVVPKAWPNATIPASTLNQTATLAGIAPERSISTGITST